MGTHSVDLRLLVEGSHAIAVWRVIEALVGRLNASILRRLTMWHSRIWMRLRHSLAVCVGMLRAIRHGVGSPFM